MISRHTDTDRHSDAVFARRKSYLTMLRFLPYKQGDQMRQASRQAGRHLTSISNILTKALCEPLAMIGA